MVGARLLTVGVDVYIYIKGGSWYNPCDKELRVGDVSVNLVLA